MIAGQKKNGESIWKVKQSSKTINFQISLTLLAR